MTGKLFAAAIAATMAAACVPAHAGVIFDLSPTNNISPRPSDDGLGQGVSVSTTTTISGFSFFANLPDGGDGKFMIWEPTSDGDQTLLFSQTVGIPASDTPSWVSTAGNIDFTLDAGSTYYFGFIGDNFIDVGFLFPIVPYSANGLSAVETGNSNYNSFDTPTFAGGGRRRGRPTDQRRRDAGAVDVGHDGARLCEPWLRRLAGAAKDIGARGVGSPQLKRGRPESRLCSRVQALSSRLPPRFQRKQHQRRGDQA